MKRHLLKILSLLLLAALLTQLAACGSSVPGTPQEPAGSKTVVDLMASVKPLNNAQPEALRQQDAADSVDFGLKLLRQDLKAGENRLLSPLSVLAALSMTANGARGETLAQMEQVLGMKQEDLNRFFRSYLASLSDSPDCRLRLANSIWFADRGDFTANQDFLQTNADYYGAELYKTPFNDEALRAINGWVKEKTEDMIPEILDSIPEDAVMYLLNALAFDAKWDEPYQSTQVQEADFTLADGSKKQAQMMYGEEGLYLEDENAVGFLKPYKGGRYAFAALLPKAGMSPEAYLETLDGKALLELLGSAEETTVHSSLPKFRAEYKTELSEPLKAMGMDIAFDSSRADLHGIGTTEDGNLCIGRVLHRTFISVDEKGTRAGAATAVEILTEGAMEIPDWKEVYLNRPFVYLLIDTETNLPFFVGILNDPA